MHVAAQHHQAIGPVLADQRQQALAVMQGSWTSPPSPCPRPPAARWNQDARKSAGCCSW